MSILFGNYIIYSLLICISLSELFSSNEIICDDTTDGCSIRCNASNSCYANKIYSQSMDTLISCEYDNSCSLSQIYCGNITKTNEDTLLNIDTCMVNFEPNTISSNMEIHCNGVKNCMINSNSNDENNNNQFISSKLECYNNDKCILYCPTTTSCSNSILICHSSSNCQCIGDGCQYIYHFPFKSHDLNDPTTTNQQETSNEQETTNEQETSNRLSQNNVEETYFGIRFKYIVLINGNYPNPF